MSLLPAGVRQIRLPLSGSPLRYVNSYLLKGDDGYILVDCGWDSPDVLEALQAGLRDAGIALGDVRTLIVTHLHTDHYGLAGTLVRLGQMRLMLHRLDWLYLDGPLKDRSAFDAAAKDWLACNGYDQERTAEEERALEAMRRATLVAPHRMLEDADRIDVDGSGFTVVWTPGHTLGHVCLYAPEQRFLISGDHVLDPITPNVSLWGTDGGNPLGDFLESLQKVAALDADLVLPAHGDPFTGLRRRVSELLQHHAEREAAVLALLDGAVRSGAEVSRALPWTRRRQAFDALPGSQQRIAVTETLSHLEHLRVSGRVVRIEHDGRLTYRSTAS